MGDVELFLGLSAGHGGRDKGTVAGAEHGIIERDYCSDFVADLEALARVNRSLGPPQTALNVEPIRLNNVGETIPPKLRGGRALARGCSVVFAVHVNALPGTRASGLHAFYDPKSDATRQIAEAIARATPAPLRRRFLQGRQKNGRYVAGGCEPALASLGWSRAASLLADYRPTPTVLVELYYATNPDDCRAAQNPAIRLGLLSAVLAGVAEAARIIPPQSSRSARRASGARQ